MAIESVGGSVVSKIVELLVEPATRQFRYMFCFNNFVQEFKEQKQNLDLALDRLQKAVEVAERNAEEIEKDVNKWLEDANNEIKGVNPLENEIGKNGKCFTWCPNCMRQFKLSKALAKKSETLRKLEENSKKFQTVSHKAPPQPIEFLPSNEFTPSESARDAFEQIMKALKDDNVNMIGLYGMGGVGKTTLVKEAGGRAKELQLFDEVLMATVSQNPNVTYIQDRMADSLGLRIEEKSKEGRASRLLQRLQGKKMLIILDDVWKDIDLQEIGIPFGDAHGGCKILLTTRLEHICSSMECQQKVFLRILSENEAWALFKIKAGLSDEDSALNTVAMEVAKKCQGLPIALVTVGRALRDKSLKEWEAASKQLKNSPFLRMEQIDEQKNAYACLKLSYDYLKFEETKTCFLLCCLFPEDHNIPIEDLTRYAVGYGLHRDGESIEDARKRVYVAIENLKACCMLLGTEIKDRVKMHDLVRDVAIQISKEYGFMVKAGIGLKEWPMSNKSFEVCTTISLMGNKLTELPEGLVCPRLKVLFFELDDGLTVPERFFEGMKEIEVLSLKGGCLSLQSLEFSTNLQSLLLMQCKCKDLIWLRKLQRLEILGFMGCYSIEELPDEIGELKELRLLDLTDCGRLRSIPENLIGRLKKLEELLIGDDSFKEWDVLGTGTGGMNASLTELNLLSYLAVLSLKMPRVDCIPKDFVFPRLHKYDIILGNWLGVIGCPSSTGLYLGETSATFFNAKTFEQLFPTVSQIVFSNIKGLKNIVLSSDQMTTHGQEQQKCFLQRLEFVEVKNCGDICTLFPANLRQALKNLSRVNIERCKSLEEVFELGEVDEESDEEKELPLLSSLTTIELAVLPELKCIWKGPTRHVSLQSLIDLKLYFLDKLTFIFTPSLAQSLQQLQTLQIDNCNELEHIIREKDDEREIIPESLGFPKLKTLYISDCGKLEYVFPVSVSPSLLNLEQMTIESTYNLKQIFYSGEGDALTTDGIIEFPQLRELSLVWSKSNYSFFGPKNYAVQLPSLQNLTICGHEELGNWLAQLQMSAHVHEQQKGNICTLFSPKLLQVLKNLRSVEIKSCESLEEVFELGEVDEESNEEKELRLLSSLTRLELSFLPELKCIWKGTNRHVSLQSLIHLELLRLDKLTFIFTPSLAQSLQQLQTLQIDNCNELEHIIREKDDEREIIPESLGFPKLKTLFISDCGKLEYVFPVSVSPSLLNLEQMTIESTYNLKQIFYSGEGDALTTDGIIEFPQLRELSLSFESNYSFFGPKNYAVQLPSLQTLCLGGHEELGNLLAQLQGLTSLETLKLRFLPDLRCIWKGLVLSNVTTLEVNECEGLTHVFSYSMIVSLIQLKFLKISSCEELEQIITKVDDEKDQILLGDHLQSLCFPSLCQIEVRDCNKLKSLFPVAMASGLPKLQILIVREASQLLGVFGQDDHVSPVNVEKEMVLPNLQELGLQQLPSIVCFSLGCYDFLFPRLQLLSVYECPKLTQKFSTTPNGSMSAQSKIPQVAEDSSTVCSLPTRTFRVWTRDNGWK